MKKAYWIILFVLVVIGELAGIQMKNENMQLICKPLIVPALIGYFASQVNVFKGIAKWVLLALIFSFCGDVLLMFQVKDSLFFLLGLSSFLIAHIFYITFFFKVKTIEQLKGKILPGLFTGLYYAGLMLLLFPGLGKMQQPVLVYGFVISFMLMLAMHMIFIKNKKAGVQMLLGATLFVISDSVLAINKFYQPFGIANLLIMLTYALAQFFIVNGVVRYMIANKN